MPLSSPPSICPSSPPRVSDERRSLAVVALDDSRRPFQRLWTDEEEIKILQGFFEFTSRRGTAFASHQYDTGPFYEEIKKQLHFEFTKNQLIEKIRRMKKKYRNCVGRMQAAGKGFSFKTAHEQAIYGIACKIGSSSTKRAHDSDDEDLNTPNVICNEIITIPINDGSVTSERRKHRMKRRMVEEAAAGVPDATPLASSAGGSNPPMQAPLASSVGIPDIIEEAVKNCFSPLFIELINSAVEEPFASGLGRGTLLNSLPLSHGCGSLVAPGMPVDQKWRTQQILELEV